MTHPLRIGLKHSGQGATIESLRAVWTIADEAGFDHLWDFDHMASIGAGGPDRPVFEGWSLLAAAAVATARVRIGCMVTGNAYRHPAMLAKIATTVDHLSGGRLEFGIGAGWAELEYEMLGLGGLENRVGRLVESLRVIRSLWTEERTDFEGRYYRLCDAIHNPKPVQRPHPPVWIGAGGDMTLKVAARHADVWNASSARDLESAAELSRRLDAACADEGRDPADLPRSAQFGFEGRDRSSLLERAAGYVKRGFSEIILYVSADDPVGQAETAAAALDDLRALA